LKENELNEFCKHLKSKHRENIYYFQGIEDFPCREDQTLYDFKAYSLDKIKKELKLNLKSFDCIIVFFYEILAVEFKHPMPKEIKQIIRNLINTKYNLEALLDRLDNLSEKDLSRFKNEILKKINDTREIIKILLKNAKIDESLIDKLKFALLIDINKNIEDNNLNSLLDNLIENEIMSFKR
jgi:hypothetical protein